MQHATGSCLVAGSWYRLAPETGDVRPGELTPVDKVTYRLKVRGRRRDGAVRPGTQTERTSDSRRW